MENVLFLAVLTAVAGGSFLIALVAARLALRAVLALAGARESGPRA